MKVLRFFGKCILAFILLSLIFWTIVLGLLQTKQGQTWGFNQLITYLEYATHTQIQVEKIHFSFPLHLQLENVSISQHNHPLMTIQDLELSCAYSNLFHGRLVFSKLHASHVNIQQLPDHSSSSTKQDLWSWDNPLLPFYVKLENIDIQSIHLELPVIETLALPPLISQITAQSLLDIQGMISNNPFRNAITAHLLLTMKNKKSELPPLILGIDTQNRQLSLSFHINPFPLQTFDPTLPSQLKAHLALYASAPILTWQNLMQNSLQKDSSIEGYFKLFLHAPIEDHTFLSHLIGQQTSLHGHYLLKSLTAIELLDLKITNSHLYLKGDALLTSEGKIQKANFHGEIENAEKFQSWIGKEMQGKIAFEGESTGALLSPSFTLHLKSPHFLYAQHLFQNVSSHLQATSDDKGWQGFLTLSFDHQKTPWQLATAFDWNHKKQLTFYQLQANALGSHLEGTVTCSTPDYICEGVLEAQSANIADISSFFDIPMHGNGEVKLLLNSFLDANQQRHQDIKGQLIGREIRWENFQAQQVLFNIQLDPLQKEIVLSDFKGEHLSWKDYSVKHCSAQLRTEVDFNQRNLHQLSTEWQAQGIQGPEGQAAQANGQAHVQNPLQKIEGTFHIALQKLQTSGVYLEELTASSTLYASHHQWPFQLKGRGIWHEDFILATEGIWHYQDGEWEVQANHLKGQFGPYPLRILQPVQFLQRSNDKQLAGLHLQWGEAEIQAEFKQEQQHIFSHFKTNAIPSELFHFIAPNLPLTGRATFQGHLEGSIRQPKGQFQIDLHHMQITEDIFTQKPFMEGRLHLDLDERRLQVKSELKGIGHTPLQIAGILPINLSLNPLHFNIESTLPFHLALNAEGDLDPYLHLFYNDVTNLSGHAKIALKLSGQMRAPQIQGHIDLVNGTYESLSTGALYHNIGAHLEGDGSKIILTQFSAQDNKNGTITATGTVNVDASKYFPFQFNIHSSRIFVMDSDYAAISASGPLYLIGNTKQSKLQGILTVDQAIIHLEEALPRQIKTVDVRYINASPEELASPSLEKKENQSPIEFDVTLNAPHHILIQGNHLKSEWKGSIAVTGIPDHLQLYGDLNIIQGEYDFNGKKFNLNQGTIHFAGSPAKKTTLYVIASKEIDRIRAEIIVKGPVTDPVISFRSNPPLAQREILSYILFNRGISNITPDQGEQLSQSFISLNSSEQTKANDNLLSRLRNNIGIDRLDFVTTSSNRDPTHPDYNVHDKEPKDIGFEVGKNINENINFSVKQSMTSLNPIIAVEVKLHKNIKMQAEGGVNRDIPFLTSIKWKKDY